LRQAPARGVAAHHVPIETFDALMLRLWHNTDLKPVHIDAEVRKARLVAVNVVLRATGEGQAPAAAEYRQRLSL
jgi:hypothetical protein